MPRLLCRVAQLIGEPAIDWLVVVVIDRSRQPPGLSAHPKPLRVAVLFVAASVAAKQHDARRIEGGAEPTAEDAVVEPGEVAVVTVRRWRLQLRDELVAQDV